MSHVQHNSGNNEWYTPKFILDAARNTLGYFDIDPASNDIAQEMVQAKVFYTVDNSGLDKEWNGKVWMNPPYSGPLIKQFCNKLKDEVDAGNTSEFITLTNNATETLWFKTLFELSNAFCFIHKRVKFLDYLGQPANTPLQGQVLCYRGTSIDKFKEQFSKYGLIMVKD